MCVNAHSTVCICKTCDYLWEYAWTSSVSAFYFIVWLNGIPTRNCGTTTVKVVERSGSVVECRTPEREVGGWKPTAAVLCPWARHFTPREYWLITQEAVAPSRHDWKIVDWDVKPQHKQTVKVGIGVFFGFFSPEWLTAYAFTSLLRKGGNNKRNVIHKSNVRFLWFGLYVSQNVKLDVGTSQTSKWIQS